jgi:hypothetical protein
MWGSELRLAHIIHASHAAPVWRASWLYKFRPVLITFGFCSPKSAKGGEEMRQIVNLPRSAANNAIVWLDAADAIESSDQPLNGSHRILVRKAADLLTPFVAQSPGEVVRAANPGLSGTGELASECRSAIAAVRISAPNEGPLDVLAHHRTILKTLANGRTVPKAQRTLIVRFLDTLASEYLSTEADTIDRTVEGSREQR